jgi:tetratricopeptide (TPR) repeat protein
MLKTDRFKAGIAVAIAFSCLAIPQTLAQSVGPNAENSSPVDTSTEAARVFTPSGSLTESAIQPEAIRIYERAVQELHQGHAAAAEKDALRALQIDKKFADAAALSATAALAQQQFDRAKVEAAQAIQIDSADEKAYVILATAQNYLGNYSAAADALRHVRPQEQETWQVAYQWARAEAGRQHLQQCLEWTNRAALSAPQNFAPLHLLHASVLLTMGETARAADELEIYLQLPSVNVSQRDLLTQELHRLRTLPQNCVGSPPATGD